MKSLLFIKLIILLIVVSSCGSRGRSKENSVDAESSVIDTTLQKTSIKFFEVEKDMGQVNEGEQVVFVYEFSNTGKADLFLQSVRAPCGCTKPKYDQKPIHSGKKGSIEVTFDTKNRPGIQRKTVSVTTNTEPPNTVLTFTCEVIPAKK